MVDAEQTRGRRSERPGQPNIEHCINWPKHRDLFLEIDKIARSKDSEELGCPVKFPTPKFFCQN